MWKNYFNRLIGVWKGLLVGEIISSPFAVLNFLDRKNEFLSKKFKTSELNKNPAGLLIAMQSVVTHLLYATHDCVARHLASGKSDFEARNESQFFRARDLSLAFIQTTVLDRFIRHSNDVDVDDKNVIFDENERKVLNDLAYLYGLTCVRNFLPHLLKFGTFPSPDLVGFVHSEIVETCDRIKPNAVALADVLAPTDFVLDSALGHSSGEIYKQLQKSFYAVPNGFQRAEYWPEITENFRKRSKL